MLLYLLAALNVVTLLLLAALWLRQKASPSADLAERLGRLGGEIQQAVSDRLDLHRQSIEDRVERKLDQHQGTVGQSVQSLGTALTQIQAHAAARAEMERRSSESLRRLEAVIAGTQSKGSAGESILDQVFSRLPHEWQVRNFRVGNKVVEFAIRLPNGLVLPIDSKWPATDLLERFQASQDPQERARIKEGIEATVLAKAREVQKYIDPALTTSYAVAAVPDPVYELSAASGARIFEESRVVVVSYGMFLPYLLLVFQTVLKSSQSVDLEKLDAYVGTAQDAVRALQKELEGRFSSALTMLGNSRSDMGVQLSKAGSCLAGMQAQAGSAGKAPASPSSATRNAG